MLVRARDHGHIRMPHQHTKAHWIDVVFQRLSCKRMTNSIGTQSIHPKLLFEAYHATVYCILSPWIATTISENWSGFFSLPQLPNKDFNRPIIEENDPFSFPGFVLRFGQHHHFVFQVNVAGFNYPGFNWATARFPHEFDQVSKNVIAHCVENQLELIGRVADIATCSSRLVFDVGDRRTVDMTLLYCPVERPLNNRNRIVCRTAAPIGMQVKPFGYVFWLELPDTKPFSNAVNKGYAISFIVLVGAFGAAFLAPIKVGVQELGNCRLKVTEVDVTGHQFVVLGPRLLFVPSQVDLAFANLDVPRFCLFAEKWFWLTHREPSRQCYENKFAD